MVATGDLRWATVLGLGFLLLLAVAEIWRRYGRAKPEWTRKLVHTAGGILCICFPFLIRSPWVVLVLAASLSALFVLAARTGWLLSLHGVKRKSRGSEYYPLAVWLVFFLAGDQTWLFVSAILVLAVGDAFAALIGSRYGVIHYEIEDEHKSLEGSLVFLVIAFLAIHLPTLLMTDLPRDVCVLSALLVATLVTGFEAISLRGADNLFVPLAVVVILGKITTKPISEIAFQNLSLLAICLIVILMVRQLPLFNVGGTIAVILFAYGTWSLGSWYWALPVFGGLCCFVMVWIYRAKSRRSPRYKVRVVSHTLLGPFLLLIVANSIGYSEMLFGPYLGASAAAVTFSLIITRRAGEGPKPLSPALEVGGLILLGTGATVWLAWLFQPGISWLLPLAQVALLVPAAYLLLVFASRTGSSPMPERGAPRFILTMGVASGVLLLQWLEIIPFWIPL